MIDLPEPKEYLPPSAVKKSPAERVAEALNSLLNLFSLPAMFGTHLAIAFRFANPISKISSNSF